VFTNFGLQQVDALAARFQKLYRRKAMVRLC
jgi:hypothetical protein